MLTFLVPVKLEFGRIHTYDSWVIRALEMGINVILLFDGTDSKLIPTNALTQIQKEHNGLSYFNVNFGNPGGVRNFGLTKVMTRWVAFIDSDDKIFVDSYLNLIEKCQLEGKSIGIGYFKIRDTFSSVSSLPPTSLSFSSRVKYPGIWRYIFETDRLKGQQFCNSRSGEDIAFLASLQIRRKELCIGDELLYEYNRESPRQLTKFPQDTEELIISLKSATKNKSKIASRSVFSYALTVKICGQIIRTKLLKRDNSTELVLAGGIGNQLFQIAGALSFENPFPLFLERHLGKTDSNHFEENILRYFCGSEIQESTMKRSTLKVRYVSLALRLSGLGFSTRYAKILRRIVEIVGHLLLFRRKVYIDRIPDDGKPRKRILIGYFQDLDENQMIGSSAFQKYLKIPKTTELENISRSLSDEKSLVIHVRGGDYANEKAFGLLGPDYFNTAVARCLSSTDIDNYFIFTNDLARCKKIIPAEILEIATIYTAVEITAIQSLLAMSAAKNLIISNSTFSWWAAYLGETSVSRVFFPEPWFKTSPLVSKRARTGWIPVSHNFLN